LPCKLSRFLFALCFSLPTLSWAQAFVGTATCSSCHSEQHQQWQGSHHDLAMQPATATTVLGNFDDAQFQHGEVTTSFRRDGERFIVRTDGEDGELEDFEVAYVFGVYPLQQYLLPLSRGRLQALSIAWDARPKTEGGQRWFHLYPDEIIRFDDPLHWTGPYQNWNTRCAECHSTDLQKNYNAATREFDTRFFEVNVGCEACHGPGEQHVQLVQQGKVTSAPQGGFASALAQRGQWSYPEDQSIARRQSPPTGNNQVDACGRCHARRGTLGDYHYGADLLDTHRLSLPVAPLYHHDGQVLDEDYVYGSFLQSKMHQAGVVCSNCHNPHSLTLRAPGNGVCAQCHKPQTYDTPDHHHHPQGSTGASCANCHMPETTYMVVDPRRDHSMRVPRPDLSLVIGTPNACNQCHTDKNADWALNALREWGVNFRDTGTHPARAFHQAARGDSRAMPRLAQIAADESAAPIWRAAAIETLGQGGGREALQTASMLLYSDDPLLRNATVGSIAFLPAHQRYRLLKVLVDDPITSVRMSVASSLAEVPLEQLPPAEAEALRQLFAEYLEIQTQHADMPSVQLQLGLFHLQRRDLPRAEAAYREALRLNPQLVPAHLNLADLLRGQGREDEARQALQAALAVAPDHGATLHALGLLETRTGNKTQALDYLRRAAAVESDGIRHRYVYAIALHDLGEPRQALAQLQDLLRSAPQSQEVLLALANYSEELGQRPLALNYARALQRLAPRNPNYQQLVQRLSQ
jgi:tetratricopeptide (TPR) repeat protein